MEILLLLPGAYLGIGVAILVFRAFTTSPPPEQKWYKTILGCTLLIVAWPARRDLK